MARKSKANEHKPALVALVRFGATVPEACGTLGISVRTFYRYQADDESFCQGVARAREEWAANQDEEVNAAAARSVIRYLTEGETVEREVIEERTDAEGKTTRVVKKTIERRPCPKWIFDKLMPESVVGQLHQHLHMHGEGDE